MTILNESFNVADQDALGPDQTWVEDEGDADVVSNKAAFVGGVSVVARVNTSLATADMYVQAQVEVNNSTGGLPPGIVARKAASATLTHYLLEFHLNVDQAVYYQRIGGTYTQLGANETGPVVNYATQYLFRLEVEGTTLRGFIGGSSLGTRSNSAIDGTTVGGKQCGIRCGGGAGSICNWDDWEAGDITAAVATPITSSRVN
jgi:hypothetical protein